MATPNRTDTAVPEVSLARHLGVRDLEILALLLTHRNVSYVASQLGQSQPSISIVLKRLRSTFGDALLVRSGRESVLTDRGAVLLAQVKPLLDGIGQLFESAEFDPSTSERTIRIAAAGSFEVFLIPRLAAALRSRAPLAILEFSAPTLLTDLQADMQGGKLDAVVGNWPVPPPNLKHMGLVKAEMACLVCKSHPLADSGSLTLEQYLGLEHISPSAPLDLPISPIDGTLQLLGLSRKVSVTIPDYSIIPEMVPGTTLAFTVGRPYAEFLARNGDLRALAAPRELGTMNFYLLWHERSQASGYHQWLRSVIRDVIRSNDLLSVPDIRRR